jgi:transposase InsO family protein
VRYERARPGELLHIDTKKLGRIQGVGHRIHGDRRRRARGVGWEFAHVCVDDHTRLAYVEIGPSERKEVAVGFLDRALEWFGKHGVEVQRVMMDNGSCYLSREFRRLCSEQRIKHLRTKPYTPKTSGKAERFIQTMLRKWAYRRPYGSSARRAAALLPWLEEYNLRRPHRSLGMVPPMVRLRESCEQPL